MSDSDKPKPCPFCSWPALALLDWQKIWAVHCNNDGMVGKEARPCNAVGPERQTEAEAIAAWNERHETNVEESSGCVWNDIDMPCQTAECGVCTRTPDTKAARLVEELGSLIEHRRLICNVEGDSVDLALGKARDTILALTDEMEKMQAALDWYANYDPEAVEAIRAHAAIQKEK